MKKIFKITNLLFSVFFLNLWNFFYYSILQRKFNSTYMIILFLTELLEKKNHKNLPIVEKKQLNMF